MAQNDHNQILRGGRREGGKINQTIFQETTVRTGHGTTDWFQIGKGVCQGCILLPFRVHHEKGWAE